MATQWIEELGRLQSMGIQNPTGLRDLTLSLSMITLTNEAKWDRK